MAKRKEGQPHLIRKNPIERIGTIIGAASVENIRRREIYMLLERDLASRKIRKSIRAAVFLHILNSMAKGQNGTGEMKVSELAEKMQRSAPQISIRLKELRDGGVLSVRKFKNWHYYRISDQGLAWWKAIS